MGLYGIVDGYKICHPFLQPKSVSHVFTGWTGRYNKYQQEAKNTVIWGQQARIKQYMIDWFDNNFFYKDVDDLEKKHVRNVSICFSPRYSDFSKFRKLYELGYLPIEIWGLPEGTLCPVNVPDHWIRNTHPDFGWLPQYLEDLWSTHNWMPPTSATTGHDRRTLQQKYVDITCEDTNITKYMISDFSLRGMAEMESAAMASSGGHLLSFAKSATMGSADFLEKYYNADIEKDLTNMATPSLEHSIVCQLIAEFENMLLSGGEYKGITWDKYKNSKREDGSPVDIKLVAEMCVIKYLITDVQLEGALSYVSDTYDYWGVLTWILPKLIDDICNRQGALVIRADSGDPIKITCGDSLADLWYEKIGSLRVLKKIFGVSTNKKGYDVLPSQIRMIYADAITRERQEKILKRCVEMKISVENIFFGIGSVSYQYVTRDTRGYAIKATSCIMDGIEVAIQKNPKTDSAKASQKGCFAAHYDSLGEITYTDELTYEEAINFEGNLYVKKFVDGKQYNIDDFATIRNRLWNSKF